MRKVPTIDIRDCTDCGSCVEIAPRVFVRNNETGYIEVMDLPEYPEEDIQEAMVMCPADCITWDEI